MPLDVLAQALCTAAMNQPAAECRAVVRASIAAAALAQVPVDVPAPAASPLVIREVAVCLAFPWAAGDPRMRAAVVLGNIAVRIRTFAGNDVLRAVLRAALAQHASWLSPESADCVVEAAIRSRLQGTAPPLALPPGLPGRHG